MSCGRCGSRVEPGRLSPEGRCGECEGELARWVALPSTVMGDMFGIRILKDNQREEGLESDLVYLYCAKGTAEDVSARLVAFLNGGGAG
jgi:hypothetical protein